MVWLDDEKLVPSNGLIRYENVLVRVNFPRGFLFVFCCFFFNSVMFDEIQR